MTANCPIRAVMANGIDDSLVGRITFERMISGFVFGKYSRVHNAYLFVLILTSACTAPDRHNEIAGTWKIDSVYTYYNGFGSMETTIVDLEHYTYLPDGTVDVSWSGTTRSMQYDLSARDTLKYYENKVEVSRYFILKLASDRMVLRKEKAPLFTGKGQQRYEIRYFSRLQSSGS